MNNYKPQLKSLLFDLKNKPHCILEKKAMELEQMIESYMAGDITLPDTEDDTVQPLDPEEAAIAKDIANGIAIIDINGIICKRVGLPQEILEFFGLCDLDFIDAQLKAAMADESVTAVILNVCSPGGYTMGLQSTYALISKLSEVKETIVYSDLLNCSAAYEISSAANTIIVSRDAEVGSIGAYLTVTSYAKMLESEGITVTLLKGGALKAIGNPTQVLTDEQKAYLQGEINATWEQFKATVNIKRTVAESDMQGQSFSGEVLVKKGLVDGFADSIEEVIAALQ